MNDIPMYEEKRENAQILYKSFSNTCCPALNSNVSFSSSGFNHLIYRQGRVERDRTSQIMRFSLLARAHTLIGLTTTIQEYEITKKEFIYKKRKEKVRVMQEVQYWGLIAIMNQRKIKVVLRKVGNGNIHFWSVIPAWVTNKTRDGRYIRTMKGNPDLD